MKKIASVLLIFCLAFSAFPTCFAISDISPIIKECAEYIYSGTLDPTVGSVGGEWALIGLARSGADVPDAYYKKYYENVRNYLKKNDGVISGKKNTEYARVVLALTAIGENPEDVDGYNLLVPLGDYEKTVSQGLNGAAWALIALDSGGYEIPINSEAVVRASREMYVQKILDSQHSDGGWALNENSQSDVDITAMALTALSGYRGQSEVAKAEDKALEYLSSVQNDNGGFSSRKTENAESTAQVLAALCTLGIDINDDRLVKNQKCVLDGLLDFYNYDGSFNHTKDGVPNRMAAEQALYAMAAYERKETNKTPIFDMSDVEKRKSSISLDNDFGLSGKNADIKKMPVKAYKTFSDISGCAWRMQIEELASRGIINGKSQDTFDPDGTMTRAEFAAIVTGGLGLDCTGENKFSDVSQSDWFFGYVSAAHKYGIIQGVTENTFNPDGLITKEEAAVMVSRAAKLCGLDGEYEKDFARDILAAFTDYVIVSDWSYGALAFCYENKILPDEDLQINPKKLVTRAEVAAMLYNMLDCARLL